MIRSVARAVFVFLMVTPGLAMAQPIVIDSFTTNQPSLALTFPPAGTTASSSVSGAGILPAAGERDLEINLTAGVIAGNQMSATVSSGLFSYSQDATISGNGKITWDGTDGSPTVNPTGLGGIDLTAGGTQDALLLGAFFDDLPVNVTIEVFTDAGNASSLTLAMPGLIFASTNFVMPYSSFTPSLGAGATFSNVGAITLTLGSAVTAPDVVLDFLQTTSTLTACKAVTVINDVNGNGLADPGDTLQYTIVLDNPDDAFNAATTGVLFSNNAPLNTTLVNGSVTTTQGTVTTGNTGGDTAVAVNVGTIADAASATVVFRVTIDSPLPAGVTQISCQGLVTSSDLTALLTDDCSLPGPADPTTIPVTAAPVITATKTGALVVDGNANGQINPGDTIEYTIVITNSGNMNATGINFTDTIDPNAALVVGSVTTTQGTVTLGNTAGNTSVAVNVGTVNGNGGTVTIKFRVTVDNPLAAGVTQITNQGTVTGTNIPPKVTDDPDPPGPGDPTGNPVVPLPVVPVVTVPTLNGIGLAALILALLAVAMVRLKRRAV